VQERIHCTARHLAEQQFELARVRPVIAVKPVGDMGVDACQCRDHRGLRHRGVGARGGLAGREGPVLLAAQRGVEDQLRQCVIGSRNVVVGQSGVGKSSLLNSIEVGLELKVSTVSSNTEKGRHTTTAARLIPLEAGGYVVDTPGIRQFQLWDVIPEELSGFCPDLRPYVSHCRFPDCTHMHEADCAVKDAVADNKIDVRRYESYFQIRES